MYSAGMGIHADKVPLDDIVLMAKFLVVAEILYVFNLVWTKLGILLMYYRIFHFPYFKKVAYVIGAFIIAWVITISYLLIHFHLRAGRKALVPGPPRALH